MPPRRGSKGSDTPASDKKTPQTKRPSLSNLSADVSASVSSLFGARSPLNADTTGKGDLWKEYVSNQKRKLKKIVEDPVVYVKIKIYRYVANKSPLRSLVF